MHVINCLFYNIMSTIASATKLCKRNIRGTASINLLSQRGNVCTARKYAGPIVKQIKLYNILKEPLKGKNVRFISCHWYVCRGRGTF